MSYDSTEDIYLEEFSKNEFFNIIKRHNIDMDRVSVKKKEYNDHYHKFNVIIYKLKEENDISLFDIAMYLYKDYFDDINDVMNCFDENNKWALKEEANLKYHKGSLKTILDNFLFF